MSSQVHMPRHIAIVNISEQMIAAMLDLPEGVQVIGVRDNFMTMSIHVMVEGDPLPENPEATYPITLPVTAARILPALLDQLIASAFADGRAAEANDADTDDVCEATAELRDKILRMHNDGLRFKAVLP